MMKTSPIALIIIAAAGLAGGLLLGGVEKESPASEGNQELHSNSPRPGSGSSRSKKSSSQNARPQSSDTLESIKTAPPDELYSRLALWLMTADEADIASYWDHFVTLDERPRQIYDLVMIGWTRVNPEAAIAAVAGTSDEQYSWWAWSCHEPERALKVVMESDPDKAGYVTWGLGEFNPKWVRENWDKIPKDERGNALAGISKWAPTDDPMATAELQLKNGMIPSVGALRYLVRQDPQAAYSWFQENSKALDSRYGESDYAYRYIGAALAKDAPEVLQEIIGKTTDVASRYHLESAAFEQILKSDPEAALSTAQSHKSPEMAAHFMSQAGLKLANTDPDRAFQVAAKVLETSDNPFAPIVVEKNGSETALGNTETGRFIAALAHKDPKRTVEDIVTSLDEHQGRRVAIQAGVTWANQDPEGMRDWLEQNNHPSSQLLETSLVNSYVQTQRFEDAIEMIQEHPEKVIGNLPSTYQSWKTHNPTEARQWLESSGLTPAEKQNLETPAAPSPPPSIR